MRAEPPTPLRPLRPLPGGRSGSARREPERPLPSFDRDAARQAWRQVARTRGAGRGIDLQRPARGPWTYWAAAIGLVALVAYAWYPSSPSETAEPGTESTTTAAVTPGAEPGAPPVGTDPTAPPVAHVVPAQAGAAPPLGEPSRQATAAADPPGSSRIRPRLPPRIGDRTDVPAGTPRIKAEAYRKLPRGRGDTRPLGGIGPEGLHVDHLSLGTRYRNGGCEGEREHFTARRGRRINACIRVVHRRIPQQLLVRWERDGKLVWRQWLPVPAAHAYRSRASIPAKKRYRGAWTVRVVSLDGVELARQSFTIR